MTSNQDRMQYQRKKKQLEILKALHGKKTMTQEQFLSFVEMRDRDHFIDNINELEKGFEFMDWKIQIPELSRGKKEHGTTINLSDSTFNPLFFCLNATELLVLVEALQKSKRPLAQELIKMIGMQLSAYSKQIVVKEYPTANSFLNAKIELRNRQEEEIYNFNNIDLFCIKSGYPFRFRLRNAECIEGYVSLGHIVDEKRYISVGYNDEQLKQIDCSQVVDIERLPHKRR